MIEFSKFFNDEYQFTLNEVAYSRIEETVANAGLNVNIRDDLNATVENNHLYVTFCRSVFFTPEALYKVSVSLGLTLTFRNNIKEDIAEINWSEELITSENPYLGNIVSRASYLISTITSSYGQQPFITPPGFLKNNQ